MAPRIGGLVSPHAIAVTLLLTLVVVAIGYGFWHEEVKSSAFPLWAILLIPLWFLLLAGFLAFLEGVKQEGTVSDCETGPPVMSCPNSECPDMKLTGIAGRYRSETSVCPRCGSGLVEVRPEPPKEDESVEGPTGYLDFEEFVPVLKMPNSTMIPLAKSLLNAAGIRYFIKNERVQDLHGHPRPSPSHYLSIYEPKIFVEPKRAQEAYDLLVMPDENEQ